VIILSASHTLQYLLPYYPPLPTFLEARDHVQKTFIFDQQSLSHLNLCSRFLALKHILYYQSRSSAYSCGSWSGWQRVGEAFRTRASWSIQLCGIHLLLKQADYAVVRFRLRSTIWAKNELVLTELVALPLPDFSQIHIFIISHPTVTSPFVLKRVFERYSPMRS